MAPEKIRMLRVRMMNPPPQKENSSANHPIYWEMSRGASGCMGMFEESVEEIWRGVGKTTAATALRASWDRLPEFAGWAKLWRTACAGKRQCASVASRKADF
jgi:hypothetical protein